jgi:hypothetical protein
MSSTTDIFRANVMLLINGLKKRIEALEDKHEEMRSAGFRGCAKKTTKSTKTKSTELKTKRPRSGYAMFTSANLKLEKSGTQPEKMIKVAAKWNKLADADKLKWGKKADAYNAKNAPMKKKATKPKMRAAAYSDSDSDSD